MDTNRIKNVALGARAQLMTATETALDRVLAADSRERVARPTDVSRIEDAIASRGSDGRDKVIEQVAYTWFNRLCALRYMDARGYTPVGIVSPRAGETLPAVLADVRRGIYEPDLEISAEAQREVSDIIDGTIAVPDPLGHAYVLLLLAACSMYARSMDYLFGAGRDLGPAIELLAPTDLLSEGSLLQRICAGLDEDTCNEGVEVMGWLYQFYVSERKDAFFASKKKATAADIAPATQLFTPNWIVHYLVENSLGRLWMLNFPDSELKNHMDYYVEPEEPEDDFLKIYSPEDITFLDPACGSGHILVYAFDLLYLMYEEEGYRPADIPELILKNNLTGIEIDDRAAEIASFCLEMKALEKDEDFLTKDVDASIAITHRFNPTKDERKLIPSLCANVKLMKAIEHFDEVGSLYVPEESDLVVIDDVIHQLANNATLEVAHLRNMLDELRFAISALENHYSVAVTNPPYMTSGNMNSWLNEWTRVNYPNAKADLCTCFISRCLEFNTVSGYSALVTMQSWMFLGSYEKLRHELLSDNCIITMAHLGTRAFDSISGEVVSTTASVYARHPSNKAGHYFRLVAIDDSRAKAGAIKAAIRNKESSYSYLVASNSFKEIPGWPIAYWASPAVLSAFTNMKPLSEFAEPRKGLDTGSNDQFLRRWWEVSEMKIGFDLPTADDARRSGKKWFPCNKGGSARKWYGNNEYLLNWEHDGEEVRKHPSSTIRNAGYYFRHGITWSTLSNTLALRESLQGALFESKGSVCFPIDQRNELAIMALLNSSTATMLQSFLSPNLDFHEGPLGKTPTALPTEDSYVRNYASECVGISRDDWDAFETSWDFTWHPLVPSHNEWTNRHSYNMHTTERQTSVERIEVRFQHWESDCRNRFDQLKANEEELNRIFARIYGMEGEVPIEVPDDKVSVRLADLGRDVRSLVSYGVGCMFGRYSIDEPGLILADEGSTLDDYHAKVPNPSFEPGRTGIIPITEFDHPFFGDDIVAQFRRWLAAAYGEDTLGENIAFIENALGKSLRAYFARDFYNDHVKTYQKRPIYWMFSSPNRGLQALVYLHRYTPQTVATLLADYVRPLRDNLGAQARLLEVSGKAKDASLAAKYDATVAELDAWEHDVIFPLAQRHVELDLDDGVKANYGKPEFKGALRKIPGLN